MDLIGTHRRPLAVITGVTGGTGRAVARTLGGRYRLVLAGRKEAAVAALQESLTEEGYDVALATTADLSDRASIFALAEASAELGTIGTVVNTAGLSPALAGWEPIVTVNLLGTAHVLDAFLPHATPGMSMILIGSVAAYTFPANAEVDSVLDDPYAGDFLSRLEPLLHELDDQKTEYSFLTRAYGASKRGVIRMLEHRVDEWAAQGARIVSISPGTVVTPLFRKEVELNPLAAHAASVTPLRRLGMPSDIASAVDFLSSDRASYITGCDLRVDGGIVPARMYPKK